MPHDRADILLVKLDLARSRGVASELIKAGRVLVDGTPVKKASQLIPDAAEISVSGESNEVSRAGGKLGNAIAELEALGLQVEIEGKDCLDIGASTGGFTQVLLERGANRVIALDVGHGQLRPELRNNPKVIAQEKVNARFLSPEQLPFKPQFVTCDVSFISLTMMFEPIRAVAEPGAQVLLLIKPQFEVGKGNLGKGGIVRDLKLVNQVIANVEVAAANFGISVAKVIPSAVVGANGNQEYFLFGQLQPWG